MTTHVKHLLSATFGVPVAEIPENAAAGAFAPWNSLGHLELMMAVEMEFRVQIPTERMMGLSSIQAIEDFLQTQGVSG